MNQKVQAQQERIQELQLKVNELNKSVAEGWSNIKLNTQEGEADEGDDLGTVSDDP